MDGFCDALPACDAIKYALYLVLVLCLLDAVRVARGEDLVVALSRPCKLDPSRTCAPFTRC